MTYYDIVVQDSQKILIEFDIRPACRGYYFHVELKESRNCGHGPVYVYAHGVRTRPCGY